MKVNRYIPPASHPLHVYVQSVFFADSDHSRELILPKCNVDILFNLGAPTCIESTRRLAHPATWRKTLVAGLQKSPRGGSRPGPCVLCLRRRHVPFVQAYSMAIDHLAGRKSDALYNKR
jgi:hypothetical protein